MNFAQIETLFSNKENRTIDYLSSIYENKSLLKEKIQKVGVGILDNKQLIRGKKVLLKPNWVLHNRIPEDNICLRTNDSFLLAALEVILEQKPERIVIGDAPIQGCNWDKMLSQYFLEEVDKLRNTFKIPIEIKDFRRVTFDPSLNNPVKERNPLSDYLIFDLGKDSFLEPISMDKNIFRVTNYDPDRLAESHRKGVHKYCITKELFEADVIISIPKIKTHQKTGITGALKNLVGINGDKDYLPHHRIGGVGFGGDCYPGKNVFRLGAEYLLDMANRRQGKIVYKLIMLTSTIIWKLSNPQKVHNIAAGWYGNDTTWRMVLDLNKIAVFGKSDGSISDVPQRTLFSLCDGIIGGQGDGPLNPEPLPLGIISFTNSSGLNDICMGTLMGFDIEKIPLLKSTLKEVETDENTIVLNGENINREELKKHSIITTAPPGWVEHLKI
jgi:uncharacterized protein (DUF362 family)